MDSYRFGCAMAGYTPILPKCNNNTTGEQKEFFFDQVSIMRDAVRKDRERGRGTTKF